MAAISRFEDPYAVLMRGFIEQGLPDGTRSKPRDAHFSTDALLRQAGGLVLKFPAPPASMDDAWVYTIKLKPGKGVLFVLRCVETLHRSEWNAATEPNLAGAMLATITEQNRVTTEFVDSGGSISRIERAEHPDDPADTLLPDMQRWLQGLYSKGQSLNDGPAASWWAEDPKDRRAVGAAIGTGTGNDPFYRLGPDSPAALDPEDIDHLDRMRTAGTAAWVNAALMMLTACSGVALHGWQSYSLGAIPWWMLADFASGFVAVLWIPLGQALRAPLQRWIFRRGMSAARIILIVLALGGMLPCAGPCCLVGFPIGAYIIYLLVDDRAKRLMGG